MGELSKQRARVRSADESAGETVRSPLLGRRDLILLELAVRHRERRQAQRLLRELDPELTGGHAAPKRLPRLLELLRRAERAEAGGEVSERQLREVRARVGSQERAVDPA